MGRVRKLRRDGEEWKGRVKDARGGEGKDNDRREQRNEWMREDEREQGEKVLTP